MYESSEAESRFLGKNRLVEKVVDFFGAKIFHAVARKYFDLNCGYGQSVSEGHGSVSVRQLTHGHFRAKKNGLQIMQAIGIWALNVIGQNTKHRRNKNYSQNLFLMAK